MDAYQHHHQRFTRPPPPADPYYHQPPPQQHWQPSGQFQYAPPPQWGPPPPPQHHSYPPPPRYSPPPPPPPTQPNQDWAAQNWGHHQPQGWDYQGQSYEEDWGAKARAWADANKATENQQSQSHYHEQQHPPSSYQQHVPGPPPTPPPVNLAPPFSFDASSYAQDGHPRGIRDGASAADPSSAVHQQEVPSSYSSAPGNNGVTLQMPNSTPMEGHHHMQPPPIVPLADQPLEFAPRFTHENPQPQSSYSYLDSAGPGREMDHSWTAPAHYSPVMPHHDPAVVPPGPPPVPTFSSFLGSGLHPAIPSAGTPFAIQHNTIFTGDGYGIPSLSERPKKASVPNWLKDEIKKAVTTTPYLDHPKEDYVEDEVVDRSFGRRDQEEDSRSIDSSRSAEEDEDDEDSEDAARAVAINQEIRRVLTEVLLKVTDELFDEIATKVLDEENQTGEADKSMVIPNHKSSMSTSMPPTPSEDAKLLTSAKSREYQTRVITEKPGSILPGGLLGLANYASDDDEEEEEENANAFNQSTSSEKHNVDANGSSLVQVVGINRSKSYSDTEEDDSAGRDKQEDAPPGSKDIVGVVRSGALEEFDSARKTSEDKDEPDKESKPDKTYRHESKKTSESGKTRTDEKNNGTHKRNDEKISKREKTDEPRRSRDRGKERNADSPEKAPHESGTKKGSSRVDDKDDKMERERNHKGGGVKEESSRKREHGKDKEDERPRHKRSSESGRSKKRRSSSVTRGRSGKENSGHRDNESSDDESSDSKRKPHSRRRSLSPSQSPVKSRRRQISRSPHSKHSQRRHSPYSSHDTASRKRRSRSPARRHK